MITITKINATEPGAQIKWNIDLNGRPFGQIFTFVNEPNVKYWFTAQLLNGISAQFKTYESAERWIRVQAGPSERQHIYNCKGRLNR